MTITNPWNVAREIERNHPQASRRGWADYRAIAALHESAHAMVGACINGWGGIEIPFVNPRDAAAFRACGYPENAAELALAGCVIDEIIYGHSLFSSHDYQSARSGLICAFGEAVIDSRIKHVMQKARARVLKHLPGVQSLATAAMAKNALKHSDFKKSGAQGWLHFLWGRRETQSRDRRPPGSIRADARTVAASHRARFDPAYSRRSAQGLFRIP